MDFLFTKGESEDSMPKHDVFDPKYTGGLLDENWTNPDDLLDSIFSMDNDFLNNYDQTRGFETLDDLSEHIKMEAEEYEMSTPSFTETSKIDSSTDTHNISSNSSDSGLSSDNLDVEMSPIYEPLSPTVSSPGPSISEQGEKKDFPYEPEIDVCSIKPAPPIENLPKVIVKKIPQVITFPVNKVTQPKFNITNGKEIKIVKLSPQMITATNNKKVTIQVKNSSSGAKLQTTPGTFFINNGKLTEVKKLVRVQSITNPRSVLLPVSIQDVKDLKAFKIINPSTLKAEISKPNGSTVPATYVNKNLVKSKIPARGKLPEDSMSDNTSDAESYIYDDTNNDGLKHVSMYEINKKDETNSSTYPKLILTAEEKRLLAKEGISLPTHYPLTKHEERELKRIRRKIRNKISAQDSRKRKKEYVDGLEERVKQCTEENQTLMKRIRLLQTQNQNLMSQMKKLQSLLSKGTNKTAQPTTCLMVLLLSLALIAAPNLKLGQNVKESELEEAVQETMLQNRRNLLFDTNTQSSDILDEEINMSEIFSASDFSNEREHVVLGENCKSASLSYEPSCKKPKFIDFDVDDTNWYHSTKEVGNLQKLQNTFNQLAHEYQENKKSQQTSGFNIEQNLLDKDVLDMISPKSNGLYELNVEKLMDLHNGDAILDVTQKFMYADQTDDKLNSSEVRHAQKY